MMMSWMSGPEREKVLMVDSINISVIAWKSLCDLLDGPWHRLSGYIYISVVCFSYAKQFQVLAALQAPIYTWSNIAPAPPSPVFPLFYSAPNIKVFFYCKTYNWLIVIRKKGDYYIIPQSFMITFSYSLA